MVKTNYRVTAAISQPKEYDAQKIINKRIVDNVTQYLVRWVGYTKQDDTWEPIDHLRNVMELIEAYENNIIKKKKKISKSKNINSTKNKIGNALFQKQKSIKKTSNKKIINIVQNQTQLFGKQTFFIQASPKKVSQKYSSTFFLTPQKPQKTFQKQIDYSSRLSPCPIIQMQIQQYHPDNLEPTVENNELNNNHFSQSSKQNNQQNNSSEQNVQDQVVPIISTFNEDSKKQSEKVDCSLQSDQLDNNNSKKQATCQEQKSKVNQVNIQVNSINSDVESNSNDQQQFDQLSANQSIVQLKVIHQQDQQVSNSLQNQQIQKSITIDEKQFDIEQYVQWCSQNIKKSKILQIQQIMVRAITYDEETKTKKDYIVPIGALKNKSQQILQMFFKSVLRFK